MELKQHVTMADIARVAGVSAATVSMSLRNKPGIPAETRTKIAGIAQQLGYQTNPFVSALMRSRRCGRPIADRPVLAFVCGLEERDGWRNAPSAMRRLIFRGAMERAHFHGYDAQEFWLHQDGMSPARFSAMLRARGIQGVLLGPRPDRNLAPPLVWDYFSAVSLSVPTASLPIPTVCNDNFFSSLRAVQECHRLGYRRPGLLMRKSHRTLFQGRWEAGVVAAQQSLPDMGVTQPFYSEHLGDPEPFEVAEFKRWLAIERPDVLLMLSHGIEQTERLLDAIGYRVPEKIGLVGLSCPEWGDRVSGIFQNGLFMGATAVDVLVGRLERDEKGVPPQPVTTMIEGIWNPGTTVRQQTSTMEKRRLVAREAALRSAKRSRQSVLM